MDICGYSLKSPLQPFVTACKGAFWSIYPASRQITRQLFNRVLYRTVTINNRDVQLLRHIPGLGSLNYVVFRGRLMRWLVNPAPVCKQLKDDEVLIRVPNICARTVFPKENGFFCFANESKPNIIGLFTRYAVIAPVAVACLNTFGIAAVAGVVAAASVLIFKTPSTLAILKRYTGELNIKGTVINNFDVDSARKKLKGIEDQAKKETLFYCMMGYNCSQLADDLIRAGLDRSVLPYLKSPLLYQTPTNIALMVHNISQITVALNR